MDLMGVDFFTKPIFRRGKSHLGPGAIRILELVHKTGSLSKTYEEMNISSSKGWKILKEAEEVLGFTLVESKIGGVGGGGSQLTPKGLEFHTKYNNLLKELEIENKKIFKKYF